MISFSSVFFFLYSYYYYSAQQADGSPISLSPLSLPALILLFLTLPVSPAVVFLSDQSQVVASVSHVFHQGCILQTHTLTLPSAHTHTLRQALLFLRKRNGERKKEEAKKDGRMMKKETEDDVVFELNYTL